MMHKRNDRYLIDSDLKLILANKELEKRNTELATYIKAIGEHAMVSVTDNNGKITDVNERFCLVSGYSINELIGQTHAKLNSQIHPKTFFEDMWEAIATGNIWRKEICNRAKNGKLYWIDSVIVQLKDDSDQIYRYISISIDISKRKKTEQILAEKLREKDSLYAIQRYMIKGTSLDHLCKQIIKRLIATMLFPKRAACSIQLDTEIYSSSKYAKSYPNNIYAKIKIENNIYGQIKLSYSDENTPSIQSDKQRLINLVSKSLGQWIERRDHEQHIYKMATYDPVTGLHNRFSLLDRISKALDSEKQNHSMTTVLTIDLDNFKIVNDTVGHKMGDLLLQKVAARLLSCVQAGDTIARQGGDEFIVVLPNLIETNDAELVTKKIITLLSKPYHIEAHEFHLTCSIGIAFYPIDGENTDILLKHSDMAMYAAKSAGRNSFRYFSEEMNRAVAEKHKLMSYLRHAIKNEELLLYYQPIVDASNNLVCLEALLRWKHSKEGWIPPSKFIPVAEENGLIIPLSEWVIKSACHQISAWKKQGYKVPKISINISTKLLQQKDFIEYLEKILNETGVDACNLIVEITEGALMSEIEHATNTINQLGIMGASVAIDDFGTGYSSLSYLKNLPIHKLKIDRSFVKDIPDDENDSAIVIATITMAHSLGIEVIAEGIETKEQLAFLKDKDCDFFQGFYFSTAQSPEEIKILLDSEGSQCNIKQRKA